MTYDTDPSAPEAAVTAARTLHEYAVNQLGHHTDDVLFTAHRDGTVTGRLAPDIARDDQYPLEVDSPPARDR